MKTDSLEYAESPRVALWTALAIALGIVLHRAFFILAAGIALAAPFGWLIAKVREAELRTRLQLGRTQS